VTVLTTGTNRKDQTIGIMKPLTLDAQERRIEDEGTALVPDGIAPPTGDVAIRSGHLEFPLRRKPPPKLHVLHLVQGSSSLLHFLDRLQRFVVLARQLAAQERKDSDLPVRKGKRDKRRRVGG
jgi:hypothetical protein